MEDADYRHVARGYLTYAAWFRCKLTFFIPSITMHNKYFFDHFYRNNAIFKCHKTGDRVLGESLELLLLWNKFHEVNLFHLECITISRVMGLWGRTRQVHPQWDVSWFRWICYLNQLTSPLEWKTDVTVALESLKTRWKSFSQLRINYSSAS